MAKHKATAAAAGGTPQAPPLARQQPNPPAWLRILRWACFVAALTLSIGMLALLDQRLTGIPTVYDGPVKQYQGRSITIKYCLLSSGTDASDDVRCSFAFAAAAVGIALALAWSWLQALRRNPFRHPSARLADLVLCVVWLAWWVTCGVLLCIWTDAANRAGAFLGPARNARNGLCVMAWAQVLLVAALVVTAGLLYSPRSQPMFDKWEAKAKARKATKEEARLRKLQDAAAARDAAAAQHAAGAAHAGAGAAPAAAGDDNPFRPAGAPGPSNV